ncbi:MAG: lactamase, partial [Chloroflexi bacterium]|nr:lactamase [Chloroflexota bacterium]
GRRLFFTGDTTAGLGAALAAARPDLLVVEVTYPSRMEEMARRYTHMTPSLLATELMALRREGRVLPRILAVHMHPTYEAEIWRELMDITDRTGCRIDMAREGMALTV